MTGLRCEVPERVSVCCLELVQCGQYLLDKVWTASKTLCLANILISRFLYSPAKHQKGKLCLSTFIGTVDAACCEGQVSSLQEFTSKLVNVIVKWEVSGRTTSSAQVKVHGWPKALLYWPQRPDKMTFLDIKRLYEEVQELPFHPGVGWNGYVGVWRSGILGIWPPGEGRPNLEVTRTRPGSPAECPGRRADPWAPMEVRLGLYAWDSVGGWGRVSVWRHSRGEGEGHRKRSGGVGCQPPGVTWPETLVGSRGSQRCTTCLYPASTSNDPHLCSSKD